MKHFLNLFSGENIKNHIFSILERFQVSLGLIVLVFASFIFLIHGNLDVSLETHITKLIFSAILSFFLSVSLYLTAEVQKFSKQKTLLLQFCALCFGVFFYFTFGPSFDDFDNWIYFLLTLIGVLAFLFFSPFLSEILTQTGKQEMYYNYFYKISIVFLFSCIVGASLFVLGFIAIATIFTLFDIEYSSMDKLYGDWASIALALFAPLFALTQIPEAPEMKTKKNHENAFFSFLIKFTAIPFILIYFIILYAYSLKVLLHFSDWPRGEVTWMVIGFSLFGYLTYIFSYALQEKYSIIQKFRTFFPYMVVPQTSMLFYAIYLRIAQYDITINRYFVVVFGIWLLSISLYYIFSKQKYLALVPALLTLFTLIISIGPWSVYQLPESRQFARLEKKLIEANILQEGKIIPLKDATSMSPQLSGEIYDAIEYVCGFDNCEKIKTLFSAEYSIFAAKHKADFEKNPNLDTYLGNGVYSEKIEEEKNPYRKPSKWEIVAEMTHFLKVQAYYPNSDYTNAFISYNGSSVENIFPLQVGGYDTLLSIQTLENTTGYSLIYNTEKRSLILQEGESIVEEFSLALFISDLQKKYFQTSNSEIPLKDMTFNLSGKNYEGVIYFRDLTLKNPTYSGDTQQFGEEYVSGYMLLKKKN